MSNLPDEVLQHRDIYVPRGASEDTIQMGMQVGLAVAREHRVRPTVVAPQKAATTDYPELAKLEIVTERSGQPKDGGVILAWCPTYKVMDKVQRLKSSVVVLVEWIPGEFEAWARLRGAYNVVSGEIMDAGLDEEATKALQGIVTAGYKGWHDDYAQRVTRRFLDDLAETGCYDRDLVLAFARQTKSERSVAALTKILDRYDESRATPPAAGTFGLNPSRDW